MSNIHDLKLRLADVPGIEGLTMTPIGGRQVFGFDGLIVAVDPTATDQEIDAAIRATADMAKFGRSLESKQSASLIPSVALNPEPRKAEPMSAPKPGSFAADLRAMMDEAREGVAQARRDGKARVGEAVSMLNDAKVATAHVAGKMADAIKSEASDVMAELGQISNDLGLDQGE
jgi:hypothetical protein